MNIKALKQTHSELVRYNSNIEKQIKLYEKGDNPEYLNFLYKEHKRINDKIQKINHLWTSITS